ncbi:cell division control protein 48 [Halorubrum coriense DSM 10284]|uniref:Cell division control protein 48 n=1 Tax=Halorubrum coriense DSM 10284 TaxID=1227466 RepID=M0E4E8_9EURY|nr:AAA family ATPase [Halorubrum coriense]ELZ42651.1 cell division control protein 48 [Halorubrum coriense DSM 10284]
MTEEPTFAQWLEHSSAELELTPADIRYEVRGEEAERRLDDLLCRADRDSEVDDEVLRFSADNYETRTWYRYIPDQPDDSYGERVRRYDRCEFDLESVCGDTVPDEYSFEIEFEVEVTDNEHPFSPDGSSSIGVSLDVLIDCKRTREFRVAGLREEREAVLDFLESDRDRWGLSPEHGMLLEGPPGTGKTEVVVEACRELFGAVPVKISGPEILSRWVGESERTLRERFETAREDDSNVLYIDEIDSIARSRGKSTQEHSAQIVAQLLVLLDGIDSKRDDDQVKVIASTNMAGMVDEALRRPGRLGRTESFETLGESGAVAVLHHYLDEVRRHTTAKDRNYLSDSLRKFVMTGRLELLDDATEGDEIASLLAGRTGADIEQVVQRATRFADKDAEQTSGNSPRVVLTGTHLSRAADNSMQSTRMVSSDTAGGTANAPNFSSEDPVVRVGPNRAEEKIKSAFARFLASYDDCGQGEFRKFGLTENDILSGPEAVRTRLWEQFTPDRRYPVCVYIDEFNKIGQASAHSDVANALVEAVCDRLIASSRDDVPPVLFGYAAPPDTNLPSLEKLATR